MTATAKKFDLVEALESAGYITTNRHTAECDPRYTFLTLTKDYVKTSDVVWYGTTECHLIVDVQVVYFNDKPVDVVASNSYGKVKDYGYSKRAFNAIRDTVEYAGFEF